MPKRTFTETMEKSVSIYAYGVAFLLVVYMLGSVAFGGFNFFSSFGQIASYAGDPEKMTELAKVEKNLLHTIAFAVVLIKAFTILMSYGRSHHINVKHILEIAIIAPVIELVFAAHSYSTAINIIFATMAILFTVIYLFFYKTIKEVNEDFKEHDEAKLNGDFTLSSIKKLKDKIRN